MRNLTVFILILWCLTLTGRVYADSETFTRVQFEPLTGEVSFSSVVLDTFDFVTCPTVAMRGRKEISILNTSLTADAFLSDVSGNTTTTRSSVKGTLYPRQRVTFKLSSDVNLYVTSNSVIVIEVIEIR